MSRLITALLGAVLGFSVAAVDAADALPPAQAAAQLDRIERQLSLGVETDPSLAAWQQQARQVSAEAAACIAAGEAEVARIDASVTSLGASRRGEPVAVARKREELVALRQATEKQVAECRLLGLRSAELERELTTLRERRLTQALVAREPGFFELLAASRDAPTGWWAATKTFVIAHHGLERLASAEVLWLLVVVVALAATLANYGRRRLAHLVDDAAHWDDSVSSRSLRALCASVARWLIPLAVTGAIAIILFLVLGSARPVPIINLVAYGLPFYFLSIAVVQSLLSPPKPATSVIAIDPGLARLLSRRLMVLVALVLAAYLVFATLFGPNLPRPVYLLTRDIFLAAVVANLVWVLWLVSRVDAIARYRTLRVIAMVLLLGSWLAEWAGLRNLALAVLRALVGTVVIVGIGRLLQQSLRELFDGLATGRRGWHRRIRAALGLETGAAVPGMFWMRPVVTVVVWGILLLVLLRVWGVTDVLALAETYLAGGFTIGNFRFVPLRFVLAVALFAGLITLGGWVRTRMEKDWLRRTSLERGAREALVTMSGYIVVSIAVLAALGIMGVELQNIAIIAGALSVGIGFGLQNIVNNFVSGLILLFERPVKTGDWVVVGGTEGYVKRIRIRSTQIQTFDQADVIVPNSELISGQVTNWMLHDQRGRVRIPIGVAYGSDTALVKKLLIDVAERHPQVIHDDPENPVTVLFRAFGESSLDFELRFHIQNIDKRLGVISDVNFAIDQIFREHGVEIPFPQRDIHIRNWPGPVPGSDA